VKVNKESVAVAVLSKILSSSDISKMGIAGSNPKRVGLCVRVCYVDLRRSVTQLVSCKTKLFKMFVH
jgi:hypothetical protein